VEKLGRSSVTFGHGMRAAEGREVLRGSVTMVFVDEGGRPAEIPEGFRRAFEKDRALS
jgi:acyl-CoA thioesterase FadM